MKMKRIATRVWAAVTLATGLSAVVLWFASGGDTGTLSSTARAADLTANTLQATRSAGDTYCVTLEAGGLYAQCDQVFSSLQEAVDAATGGETIKVASGIYTEVHARPVPPGSAYPPEGGIITQVVYISKTVILRGGYTTANWLAADADSNPTTLDAGGQGRVVYVTGDHSTTIEGFRITGGDATGLGGDFAGAGGGIHVATSTVAIRDNHVFSNCAGLGGAVYLRFNAAVLSDNMVVSNTASAAGGGVYAWGRDATLSANAVSLNLADYGGGVYAGNGETTLEGNTIARNTAREWGGGLYVGSNGITLARNTILENAALTGGAMHIFESDATLVGNTIRGNTASAAEDGCDAAIVWLYDSDSTLVNNWLADNVTNTDGACLCISRSRVHALYTTLAHNDGAGVFAVDASDEVSVVAMTNTLLVSHTVGVSVAAGSTATLEATLWGTATWANLTDHGGTGTFDDGAMNYRGDPGFAASNEGDYHIGSGSAALDVGIDAGVTVDADGEPRRGINACVAGLTLDLVASACLWL
jgi:hypothetical protein